MIHGAIHHYRRLIELARSSRDSARDTCVALIVRIANAATGAVTASSSSPQSPTACAPSLPVRARLPYDVWRERNTPSSHDLTTMRRVALTLPHRPLFTIITPVAEAVRAAPLRRCIESVRAQVYPSWELCLVNDGSAPPDVLALLHAYARSDRRIHCVSSERSLGIAGAASRAVELARGEFVTFLEQEDELSPDALLEVARRLNHEPNVDLLYSDEDRLDSEGRHLDPFFKPDWSPDLLLSFDYVSHLAVYRTAVLRDVGGVRAKFEGSHHWDVVLRFGERTQRIAHIPRILYHRRQTETPLSSASDVNPSALMAGRVLEDTLVRRRTPGTVEMVAPGRCRARLDINGEPLVSIIIPTRDRLDLLEPCIRSVIEKSSYRNFEILVLDNDSQDARTHAYLARLAPPHRAIAYHAPFNWSAMNNVGVADARGEYLLLLNNDTEVIEPRWIEAMLEHAQQPEVGVVGAKLLYESGALQHAGVVVGIGGTAGHAFKHFSGNYEGFFGLAQVVRNCSAVTGACMLFRRDVFEAVGGFDANYQVSYSDVDFCLAALERGYRVVYTPHAVLFHKECATRDRLDPPADHHRFVGRWHRVIADDPYYSPSLTRRGEDYSLRL